jgi:hypothetical protein
MKTNIINTGSTTTTINNTKVNEINWDAKYDGNEADINLEIYKNGKEKENISLKLSNEELMHLLNKPSINQPVDQRLINDFSLNTNTAQIPMSDNRYFNFNKKITYKLKSKKKANKKANKKSKSNSKTKKYTNMKKRKI